MNKQKTRPTRNSINNALKNVKNDLLNHKALTARAVRQLDEHRQVMEGFQMHLAETVGETMSVVDALIDHLGCEAQVRAIIDEKRAKAQAPTA